MSAMVAATYFLFFVGVPAVAAWLAWRRWPSLPARTASVLGGVVLFGALVWVAQHEKWDADAEVRRLCAIDGGVKVYEQVRLPAERFDQWGMVSFYRPNKGDDALGPEYIFKTETTQYRSGDPEMWRSRYFLVRRLDEKVLAETVIYGRAGGDLPGPWHPSGYRCPEVSKAGVNALLKSTFKASE